MQTFSIIVKNIGNFTGELRCNIEATTKDDVYYLVAEMISQLDDGDCDIVVEE
jgi:hypothetical protein